MDMLVTLFYTLFTMSIGIARSVGDDLDKYRVS